jgi:cytoskeleton protein RodZ
LLAEITGSVLREKRVGAIGERLRREREKKKISLEEVALTTKIGTRMLRAIEEERFELLPGGIFNKGFIRAYARHVGLDEDEAVADYLAASRPQQPEESEAAAKASLELQAQRRSRPGLQLPWAAFAAVLLVTAFAFAVWGSFSRESTSKTNNSPVGRAAASTAQPVVTQKASKSRRDPPAEPSRSVAARESSAEKVAGTSETPSPETASIPSADTDSSSAAFRIVIRAREDSWIRITVDGKEIMQDTLLAQAEKSIAAHREVVVKAGNIGGLEFWFNGEKLPLQGDSDEVKTLFFEPSGLVASTATVRPPPNPLP